MSADLGELFDALNKQADRIPLAGADDARGRGRRRTRWTATASVLAVVLVVAAGIGFELLRSDSRRADQPAGDVTIPYVAPPIGLDGRAYGGVLARDGERAYAVWMRQGSTWMVAADMRSGAVAWPIRAIADAQRTVDEVVATPQAVLVVMRPHGGNRELFAFAPATGAQLWQKTVPIEDQLLYPTRTLIRLSYADGRVTGYDWASGTQRWAAGKAMRILPVTSVTDQEQIDWSGLPPTFTGDQFVAVTDRGRAEVREVTTGRMRSSVGVRPGSGETMVAYNGYLYTHDEADDSDGPVRVRSTKLDGDSSVLADDIPHTLPGRLVAMTGCGNRSAVCVITRDGPKTTITAVNPDMPAPMMDWQTTIEDEANHITSARGRTLLSDGPMDRPVHMLDDRGAPVLRTAASIMWLDAGTVAVVAPDGSGRLTRYTAGGADAAVLGTLPAEMGGASCVSYSARLACLGDDHLGIFDLTG